MQSSSDAQTPTGLKVLGWLAAILVLAGLWMAFFYAPLERVMGAVQRVFYFHVAAGWLGFAGFLGAGVVGLIYLARPNKKWDVWAVALVEVGLVYAFINIVTGSIWARPAWNTWWTWDPRLVTATVMELVYVAYLMLRQGIEEPERRARFGAIYAILGSVTVPLTYFSIRIWRTIHPVVLGSGSPTAEGGFDMTSPMLFTMLFAILAFTVLGIALTWARIRLGWLQQRAEELRIQAINS